MFFYVEALFPLIEILYFDFYISEMDEMYIGKCSCLRRGTSFYLTTVVCMQRKIEGES